MTEQTQPINLHKRKRLNSEGFGLPADHAKRLRQDSIPVEVGFTNEPASPPLATKAGRGRPRKRPISPIQASGRLESPVLTQPGSFGGSKQPSKYARSIPESTFSGPSDSEFEPVEAHENAITKPRGRATRSSKLSTSGPDTENRSVPAESVPTRGWHASRRGASGGRISATPSVDAEESTVTKSQQKALPTLSFRAGSTATTTDPRGSSSSSVSSSLFLDDDAFLDEDQPATPDGVKLLQHIPSDDDVSLILGEAGNAAVPDEEDGIIGEWSKADDRLLEATSQGEIALWRRCRILFEMAPGDILPNSWAENNPKSCWNHIFCNEFSQTLCCPAFTDQPTFFAYALQVAKACRLGKDMPPASRAKGIRNQGVIADVEEALSQQLTSRERKALMRLLDKRLGPDQPVHYAFIDHIPREWKKHPTRRGPRAADPNGFLISDFRVVQNAWDAYASDPVRAGLNLSTSRAAMEAHPLPRGRTKGDEPHHKEAVLQAKKAWILQNRHQSRAIRD